MPGPDDDHEVFERDGFVAVRGAVPPDVVAACRTDIDAALAADGIEPADPSTWTRPVVRPTVFTRPFVDAAQSPRLAETCDRVLGVGRWSPPMGIGGSLVVRFPSDVDPGDAGWHVNASFAGPDGAFWLNAASTGRLALVLFLLTDVGPDDAPTELLVGSHHDLPAVLEPYGDAGADFTTVARGIPASTFERPIAPATGAAGDAFLCSPFLVHRATWPHRGARPRIISQPPITPA